ncbi:helix-turn-helix domain-containing protein [Pseudonocardia acidicola]|uniref:PucR family transcriptional regulator n=1 Tax=Pseudonocardia acidicola TaxID=2724939 RepID=A0ABX1S3Q5_9PSEU|nr:helix-turn-helix domain-containing protein [Pseudonocardia acidicola]NMH96170.1 PucR family transcriptional regulator [Pseudonocardia acidicola]
MRKLADAQDDTGNDLIRTLWIYDLCDGDPGRTASMLRIHVSTVRFRIWHIREITGLEIGQAAVRQRFLRSTRAGFRPDCPPGAAAVG